MKLIVSTFLVYKVKKCLLKSGKVSSSDGPFMPFGWSSYARYTGIRSPPSGHLQPLCWATTAHKSGNECPNIGLIFGQYSFDFCDNLCFNAKLICFYNISYIERNRFLFFENFYDFRLLYFI